MKKVKVKSESELCLNKDIIFDILSRIEVKQLLGMTLVSKDWKQIISSCSFMKAQLKNADLVLNGFIVQDRYMLCKHDIKTVSYIPVETRNGGKVVHQTVFTFLPEQVVVLASCKGIICCRSCLPSPNPTRLYLCNPCNRDWIQLDWPPQCDITDSIALAFDFECEFEPSKFKFKLVRVKRNEEDESFSFTFDLYSLATKDWRKSTEICYCNSDLIKNKGIYIGGILYWLTEGDQILTFDVENELSLLISVPVPSVEFRSVPEACIGENEGKLNYVQVSEEGLHVWCLEDYYESKWNLKHGKRLEDFEAEYPRFFLNLKNRVSERRSVDSSPWMNPLGFKDGILLIKVCIQLYIYDINIHNITEACSFLQLNPQSMSHPTVFPHSLSLLPLNDDISNAN